MSHGYRKAIPAGTVGISEEADVYRGPRLEAVVPRHLILWPLGLAKPKR